MEVNWTYKGEDILDVTQMPDDAFGFIYLITADNGRKYIGYKYLYSKRKRNFGKKEIAALPDKRHKTYEYVTKEGKWKEYTGSNDELNALIKEGMGYKKEILYYAFDKKQLTYLELRELYTHRVLESDEFFNSNISGKFYNQYKKEN